MLQICLSAILGAAVASALPALPAPLRLLWLCVIVISIAAFLRSRLLAALVLGFTGFCVNAQAVLDQRLSADLHRTEIIFIAELIDFPKVNDASTSFLASTVDPRLPSRLRLTWYRADAEPQLGDTWRIAAKVRRPRGTRNPGGFDYEGWLHRERIAATGYVVSAAKISGASGWSLARARLTAERRIRLLLPAGATRAALLAVTVGTRHDITAHAWQQYAATGTSHLMAISGLHVGLAAFGTTMLMWGLGGLLLPAGNLRDRALLAAVPVVVAYVALSGFAVPAQRALVMTLCASALLLSRRNRQAAEVLIVAATIVLVLDPLSLLAPGFQLSFGAVALLIYLGGYRSKRDAADSFFRGGGRTREFIALQGTLLLGLLPLTVLWFGRSAWLAPLANMIVLPLFSLITVPAALSGLLLGGPLAPVGDALLWLAWYSLHAAQRVIDLLAALPGAGMILPGVSGPAMALLVLPVLWVLLPGGFPGRFIAWLSFGALLLYRPPPPPADCLDLHTLDVGQGLSVLVRTRSHVLLYDTGPAYAGGSSSAERIVLPFLANQGIRSLDLLLVSHADQDHAGGLAALFAGVRVDGVLAGEPLDTAGAPVPCERGQRWSWDGVRFEVLYPGRETRRDGNNSSCVLRIDAGEHSVLLTGDIEARAERALLQDELRRVDIAYVPHHGSRTSSTTAFTEALQASVGIVSAGHENRWGFPKEDVVARWQAAGTVLLSTAQSGALAHRVCAAGGSTLRGEFRRDARRYWHDEIS